MRGKGAQIERELQDARITPAHAGKRRYPGLRPGSGLDHPRACGEKPARCCAAGVRGGSPPRMRGKACLDVIVCRNSRITPAHAGKRADAAAGGPGVGDHPRACGEKFFGEVCSYSVYGSPPRMRGKGPCWTPLELYTRITPAHAGKSSCRPVRGGVAWDHPRACGEKKTPLPARQSPLGSPPRMRGKDSLFSLPLVVGGITPAHAGKRRN